jgi:DNA-directed RNA polymerase specialized sigma subunit, sigma24 homolog
MEDINIDFSSFDSVEEIIIHDESINKISNFVNTLPESLKTAFTLRESEGKSYEEVSVITNTPIGTVRSRIFRARELIIEYMKKELMNHE